MELFLTIIGVVLTVGSIMYAVRANIEKQKLEKLIQQSLQGLAGNICSIRANPSWADSHLKYVQKTALTLDRNEETNKILDHIHDAARDCVAAERMLGNLLNEVLTLQMGLFATDKMLHPDMNKLKERNITRQSS